MASKRQQEPEPNFEQALGELEQIVARLERGEPALTGALENYEKGITLLKLCYRLLDEAEQSVAVLTGVDEQGTPRTAPFDATATIARDTSRLASESPAGGEDAAKTTKKGRSPSRPANAPGTHEPSDDVDAPF